jgi:hypothetical protein
MLSGSWSRTLMDIAHVERSVKDPQTGETLTEMQPAFSHAYQYVCVQVGRQAVSPACSRLASSRRQRIPSDSSCERFCSTVGRAIESEYHAEALKEAYTNKELQDEIARISDLKLLVRVRLLERFGVVLALDRSTDSEDRPRRLHAVGQGTRH